VRAWLVASVGEAQAMKQIAACSSKPDAAAAIGILPELHFRLWDWVGGRYSLWSSVGLPIAIAIGPDNFRALLAGAREMDEHFASAPLEQNIPVLLGMLGIWNRNFLNIPTHAVLPYAEGLSWLPKHLQQLEMESTGKHVDRDGNTLDYPTCPVIWGDAGTNGQHAFHQWLHQGTDRISLDFIGVVQPLNDFGILGERKLAHHNRMLANCYAQRQALAFGTAQLGNNDSPLAKHQACEGNRPSNLLLLQTINPHTMGALIAAYEHKVFTQAVVWNINPFDQWGVEIGKVLAKQLLPTLGV
jgi:glucose-6-phosphate isomerase